MSSIPSIHEWWRDSRDAIRNEFNSNFMEWDSLFSLQDVLMANVAALGQDTVLFVFELVELFKKVKRGLLEEKEYSEMLFSRITHDLTPALEACAVLMDSVTVGRVTLLNVIVDILTLAEHPLLGPMSANPNVRGFWHMYASFAIEKRLIRELKELRAVSVKRYNELAEMVRNPDDESGVSALAERVQGESDADEQLLQAILKSFNKFIVAVSEMK